MSVHSPRVRAVVFVKDAADAVLADVLLQDDVAFARLAAGLLPERGAASLQEGDELVVRQVTFMSARRGSGGLREGRLRRPRRTDAPLDHDEVVPLFLHDEFPRSGFGRPGRFLPPRLRKQLDGSLLPCALAREGSPGTPRIKVLQPRLPDPDRLPPLPATLMQRFPALATRAQGVFLRLFDERRDGLDEVDEVEQREEDGRSDAADAGAAVEGAERARGT